MLILAEIRPIGTMGLSGTHRWPLDVVLGNIRTSSHPLRPYVKGRIKSFIQEPARGGLSDTQRMTSISISFNEELSAWHYGWMSNKHVGSMMHAVDVVFLQKDIGGYLTVTGSFLSGEFSVFSTRTGSLKPPAFSMMSELPENAGAIECSYPQQYCCDSSSRPKLPVIGCSDSSIDDTYPEGKDDLMIHATDRFNVKKTMKRSKKSSKLLPQDDNSHIDDGIIIETQSEV